MSFIMKMSAVRKKALTPAEALLWAFAAALLAFTYILAGGRLPGRLAGICGAAAVVAVCGVLSVARSHDAQYLNSIFCNHSFSPGANLFY